MVDKYPRSLAGQFNVNFNTLTLKPIRMVDTKPSDHTLKEIRFENGRGIAEFEDGFLFTLDVTFDELTHSYSFEYKEVDHVFDIKSDLSHTVSSTTHIISFTSL